VLPLRLAHVETSLAVAHTPHPLEGLSASSAGGSRRLVWLWSVCYPDYWSASLCPRPAPLQFYNGINRLTDKCKHLRYGEVQAPR